MFHIRDMKYETRDMAQINLDGKPAPLPPTLKSVSLSSQETSDAKAFETEDEPASVQRKYYPY